MPSQDIDSFIKSLSDIYPQPSANSGANPWPWLAAIAFSALNRPEHASKVFEYAVKQLSTHEEKLLLARKFRDSIFKAGILFGYPKTINALVQLNTVMPEELKETSVLRDTNVSLSELQQKGQNYFESGYGTTAESVRGLIHNSYPDLGFLTIAIAYGFVYSFPDVLNKYETSYTMIAALIPSELPRQVGWHFHSAIRNGATIEQVQAVREIIIKVSEFCGKQWEAPVPIVERPE